MSLYTAIEQALAGRTRRGIPLSQHSSFNIGGPADLLVQPQTVAELQQLVCLLRAGDAPWLVIGGGTNLLFDDSGYRGVIVKLANQFKGVCRAADCLLVSRAGSRLSALARYAQRLGLAGLEFAEGIPGTAGGAVRTNAGAFGNETADRIHTLVGIRASGERVTLPRGAFSFSYRQGHLESGFIVAEVTFLLEEDDPQVILERMRAFSRQRRTRQPLARRSAGCIFKNAPQGPAGQLVELAGCKGMRLGAAMVSQRHGNFIVNQGGATSAQVRGLIEQVRTRVEQRMGVVLELEVQIVEST